MRTSARSLLGLVLLAVCFLVVVEGAKKKSKSSSGNEEKELAENRLLHAAGVKDDVSEVKAALEEGADINAVADKKGGRTALMAACLAGNHRSVKLLLKRGADYKIGEQDGYTCLHGAGFQGRPKVAAVAVEAGVPAHDMHNDGFLPIHRCTWGSKAGHAETARILVEKGKEDVDALAGNGQTPLLMACSQRQINGKMVTTLLDLGASTKAVDSKGMTALHHAVSSGPGSGERETAIRALLKAGADPEVKDKSGTSASKLGQDYGFGKIFKDAKSEL